MEKTYKKIVELTEKFCNIKTELRFACEDYLKKFLSENGGRFDFMDEKYREAYQYSFGTVCIAYDGGNHPEYASNVFSEVNAVFLKDGEIYLDIEDSSEYSLARVWSLDEITAIVDAIKFLIDNE